VIIAIPVARRIRKTSVVGNKIIVEDLPIGPVEHIVCDLGYNEAPLLASVSASPEEMHGLLHEGTRIIRGETDVSSAQLKLET